MIIIEKRPILDACRSLRYNFDTIIIKVHWNPENDGIFVANNYDARFFSFLTFNYEKTSYSILMSKLVYSRCRPNTTGTWAYPMDIRPKSNINEAFIGRSGYYMNALYLLSLRCVPIGKHHNNGSYFSFRSRVIYSWMELY